MKNGTLEKKETWHDVAMRNKNMVLKYGYEFKRTFGVSLNAYMSLTTGFDIVRFDGFLKVPANVSMRDFVTEKFGEKACDMIRMLIGVEVGS